MSKDVAYIVVQFSKKKRVSFANELDADPLRVIIRFTRKELRNNEAVEFNLLLETDQRYIDS